MDRSNTGGMPGTLAGVLILLGTCAFACCRSVTAAQTGHAEPEAGVPVLHSTREVAALSQAEAARHLPVRLTGTVTFLRAENRQMFVEEDGVGLYVGGPVLPGLVPGDRVLVRGISDASFRPIVQVERVQFLEHGAMPAAERASFADLIGARRDAKYVEVDGVVQAASLDGERPLPGLRLRLRVPHGMVEGVISSPGGLNADDLLGANVTLHGVAGGAFDGRMQMTGVWLFVASADEVVVHGRDAASGAGQQTTVWAMPQTPVNQVVASYRSSNDSPRVRIAGTLTFFEPGALAVVQQHGVAMLVETRSMLPLVIGSEVEATGFAEIREESVRLINGVLRPAVLGRQAQAQAIHWDGASAGKYAYSLVSMEGDVLAVIHDSRLDLYVVISDGHVFSATLRHASANAPTWQGAAVTVGSRVRLTGICFVEAGAAWQDHLWFNLGMRSHDDIAVLQPAAWWTVRRLGYITAILLALILGAVSWVWLLRRRLDQQIAVLERKAADESLRERRMAQQERQRSYILELISSSEPLEDVLREITAAVSSRLNGARCWFELDRRYAAVTGEPDPFAPPDGVGAPISQFVAGDIHPQGALDCEMRGAMRGEPCAESPEHAFRALLSPEGTVLGYLLAAALPENLESEPASALLVGARLAELAIATRRLYSDLRHRSEYDLLTEIPNRFCLEKQLHRLITEAAAPGGTFGLIYLDLDRFKQVNDRFGHRAGDLYLQEATRRMKTQLRHRDLLARIGGDEFIALVPVLRSRADAEEIAMRMERCFDEPFVIDGVRLLGSASVGLAVFPEDGQTMEDLQRAADSAMYAHKESKRRQDRLVEVMQRVWSEDLNF